MTNPSVQNGLEAKIAQRTAVVAVVGLGYVGLPLSTVFAKGGFDVIGIDLDPGRVAAINGGVSYIQDVPSDFLLELTEDSKPRDSEVGLLRATTDYSVIAESDIVLICVPTPLGKTRDPDVSYIVSASTSISHHLHQGMLVVLESTSYPGSTEELVLPHLLQHAPEGFTVGKDFNLAFSPERVDPGQGQWTIVNTPKVIGGVTAECTNVALALYSSVVEKVIPVSSPKTAEMVKLLENTFRATNIALVNEMAIICNRLGVDVWEVIDAASTKPFGFMPFYPGPGLGGHCIPVDPQYLAWKMRTLDYTARFIQLAEEINLGMPEFVVDKISTALNGHKKPINGSKVLVLGVSYKSDVADLRESPALDVIQLLTSRGAKAEFHDPYFDSIEIDGVSIPRMELTQEALNDADCVVVTAGHSVYDWQWIVDNTDLLVDTRNATANVQSTSCEIHKL
jgi:UDP-N-acetyl-D-glucosamine dehydrogenase